MSTQIKLLRVLEEHQITRVGDNQTDQSNVRLVRLPIALRGNDRRRGQFRNDLFYRLKVVTVHLRAA